MKLDKEKLSIVLARNCESVKNIHCTTRIPRSTLSNAFAGRNISPVTAGKIAKALNVDITEIVEI